MYIFLYPDGQIEVLDDWPLHYKPAIGTLIYEPTDTKFPWTVQRTNGPQLVPDRMLTKEAKAVELLYPRSPKSSFGNNLCQEIIEPNYKG